jgi:hypothetical protein
MNSSPLDFNPNTLARAYDAASRRRRRRTESKHAGDEENPTKERHIMA